MAQYCCTQMRNALSVDCDNHADKYECPDVLIDYNGVFDEYGLIIHDGGTASSSITYCPWCGTKLPESKRDLWFDVLEELGFDDPTGQDIPESFKSSAWYESGKYL